MSTIQIARETDNGIIVLETFIQATRDSGYKTTTSALAELVDNSIQAGAKNVWIDLADDADGKFPIRVTVRDDGTGMDRQTLRQALRFGGTSRFNDRAGLGRYGMGLPNSSVSQSRRVEVTTWQNGAKPIWTYLDLDEVIAGALRDVPKPQLRHQNSISAAALKKSGTLVEWTACDRLTHARVSTMVRRLNRELGQVFRHLIWRGHAIFVNGTKVEAFDPLFLKGPHAIQGAVIYGEPFSYEMRAADGVRGDSRVGQITVTFVELPIHDLHALSNEEKRDRGISNRAGVSVVRGGREVDYGWFFMGSKRRENYDDWWRCEVAFEPVLDEAFGITHTKQQVRPTDTLLEVFGTDIEGTAKVLNGRVRNAHHQLKSSDNSRPAEEVASAKEKLLAPLPAASSLEHGRNVREVVKQVPSLKQHLETAPVDTAYKMVEAPLPPAELYRVVRSGNHVVQVLNTEHPFTRRVYQPLAESTSVEGKRVKLQMDLLLLAAARAESEVTSASERAVLADFKSKWSATLATFLNR